MNVLHNIIDIMEERLLRWFEYLKSMRTDYFTEMIVEQSDEGTGKPRNVDGWMDGWMGKKKHQY